MGNKMKMVKKIEMVREIKGAVDRKTESVDS
jgi:hypothetical protein